MKKLRDNQRSKVYAAERDVWPTGERDRKGATIADAQRYVDKLTGSAWFIRRFGLRRINVQPGRGGGMAWGGGLITLGVWARERECVILHEVAHCVAHSSRHDWRFCKTFLELVQHQMGKDAADRLKTAFKDRKVRYKKPMKRAPLSEERKAQLREQLAAARAKKGAA